jgi:Fur family ferric uptake transcriptional regulator
MEPPQDVIAKLLELGYRLTPQRQKIIAIIEDSQSHISAEEIYRQVKAEYPYVNISTVYRTLELLKTLGLVTETELGDGRLRYHPIGKGHHHHLVCQSCGQVFDLDEELLFPLKETLRERYHFEADLRHLAIFGRCRDCSPPKLSAKEET